MKKMLYFYPTAFNYCFFHPKVGLWMGSSPEQLIRVCDNIINTVALAGTQIGDSNKEIVWSNKEKNEQQIVTDYLNLFFLMRILSACR